MTGGALIHPRAQNFGRTLPPGLRRLAVGICAATDVGAAVYLLVISDAALSTSPVWSGVTGLLQLVHLKVQTLGAPLLVAAVLLALGLTTRFYGLVIVGTVVGVAGWGAIAGSWVYAATTLNGLGGLAAWLVLACVIPTHFAVLLLREERRHDVREG